MRNIAIYAILVSIFLLNGCEDIGDVVAPENGPDNGTQLSFSNDILPIFDSNCTTICHPSPASPAFGNLDLNSYVTLMDQTGPNHAPVIVPFQPDSSFLVQRIEDPGATRMPPPPNPALPPAQIDTIRQWIEEGALDN